MPVFLKNLGLDVFTENEDSYRGLIAHTLASGKTITGYYGMPYANHHLGWAQMIARVNRTEDGTFHFTGLDTHCAGICYWDVRIVSVMEDKDNPDPLSKVLMVRGLDGMGIAGVHVVNADVLPSFASDEVIHLQMIAFPVEVGYYANEDAYAETVPPTKHGKKLLLAENALFPNGLFSKANEMPTKSLTQIHGKVKELFCGTVTLGEETYHPFLDCIVETQFGDIEILHRLEDVEESQREHLKVGATVNCLCYLSGDAALDQYEQGIVLDHEHHLKLLAYSFSTGDPERLRSVLADSFIYHSEASDKHLESVDEFIDFVKYIQREAKPCHPCYATITKAPEQDAYPVGTRCLALSYGASDDFASIAFIDLNEENKIQRIYLSKDGRYRFKIDDPLPEPDIPSAIENDED